MASNPNVTTRKHGTRAGPSFRIRSHVVAGGALAAALIVGCGGWAATASLNGAVVAQGTVKVDRTSRSSTATAASFRRSRCARATRVAEGQSLFRLDDVQTRAELSIIRAQLGKQLGRPGWSRAERDNLAAIVK